MQDHDFLVAGVNFETRMVGVGGGQHAAHFIRVKVEQKVKRCQEKGGIVGMYVYLYTPAVKSLDTCVLI